MSPKHIHRLDRTFFLTSVLLSIVFCSSNLLFAQELAVPDPPPETHAPNPAKNVPFPVADIRPCRTDAEKAMDFVFSIVDTCMYRIAEEKKGEYYYLAAKYYYFLKSMDAVGMANTIPEVATKATKDAAACFAMGIVEGSGGSPEAINLARAVVEEGYEIKDRIKYLKNIKDLLKHWKDKGLEGTFDDKDRTKFLQFIDNKTYSRYQGLKKEGKLFQALNDYFLTPDRTSKRSLVEARDFIKECEFQKAKDNTQAAILDSVMWLKKLREEKVATERQIGCVEEAIAEAEKLKSPGGSLYLELKQRKAELEGLKQREKDQIQYMQELADLAQSVESRRKDVETLRARLAKMITEAEDAINDCDLVTAEKKIANIRTQSTIGWCATLFTDEYDRIKSLAEDLQKRKNKHTEVEKKIAELYQQATSSKGNSCQVLSGAADAIEKLSGEPCVNAMEATVKVTSLRNMVSASQKTVESLQSFLNGAKTYLENCDGMNADAMADSIRAYLPNLYCLPVGMGQIPTEVDAKQIEQGRDQAVRLQKELRQKATELLEFAKRAVENCDEKGRKAQEDQLREAMQRYLEFCKTYPEGVEAKLKEIEGLVVQDDQEAKATIQEGKDALKRCDVLGAYAAADELEFLGKVCGIDAAVEAQNLRTAADAIAKSLQALEQNSKATLQKARSAWQSCDLPNVKWAGSEMNRIVDPFARICAEYPDGVIKDTDGVQKLQKLAEDAAAAESKIEDKYQLGETALKNCDPKSAKTYFDEAVNIYNNKVNNNNCKIYTIVQKAAQGSKQSTALKASLDALDTAMNEADNLFANCKDFTLIYDKLKRADSEIADIRRSGVSCDVSEGEKDVAAARATLNQVITTRNKVDEKLRLAEGFLKARDKNQDEARQQAQKLLGEVAALLQNAEPDACFVDLDLRLTADQGEADLASTGDVEDIPDDADDFGDGDVGSDDAGTTDVDVEDIPDDLPASPGDQNPPKQDDAKPPQPATGPRWVLKEVKVSPENPPKGWTYSAGGASASFTIYTGDAAQFQWSPPPAHLDSNGFTMAVNVQANPAPNSSIAAIIGFTTSGFDLDNAPAEDRIAYAKSESGAGTVAQKRLLLHPRTSSTELTVSVSFMWAINFIYTYKLVP